MFSLKWLVIIWKGGGSFETGHPRSRQWKNFGRRWTWGSWKLDNFHGRHLCIIPNRVLNTPLKQACLKQNRSLKQACLSRHWWPENFTKIILFALQMLCKKLFSSVTLLKRDSKAVVFLWNLQKFKKPFLQSICDGCFYTASKYWIR